MNERVVGGALVLLGAAGVFGFGFAGLAGAAVCSLVTATVGALVAQGGING